MPNQARTLLLNTNGNEQPSADFFAQEYVPPYFRTVLLPSGLLNVRRALFGGAPDQAGMNYSIWQYMRILHSTEYAEWVTALDPRITYLSKQSMLDTAFGPSVDRNADALQFTGLPGLGDASGKLQESWTIEQVSAAIYRIMNMSTRRTETHTVSIEDGYTEFMPMTGYADFKVRVQTHLVTVPSWIVQYLAAPLSGMDTVNRAAQAANIGAEAYAELFPAREPYKLFKALWEKHILFPYKMTGYLLALIYRTEEYRVAG